MTEAILMVGLPGCGKSTYVEDKLEENYEVLSTDALIEKRAEATGKTYNETFSTEIKWAEAMFYSNLEYYIRNNISFVIDRTNLTVKSRAKILNLIPKTYTKTAIVIATPEREEWLRRLDSRPGKIIPPEILERMEKSYECPRAEEGFDSIKMIF